MLGNSKSKRFILGYLKNSSLQNLGCKITICSEKTKRHIFYRFKTDKVVFDIPLFENENRIEVEIKCKDGDNKSELIFIKQQFIARLLGFIFRRITSLTTRSEKADFSLRYEIAPIHPIDFKQIAIIVPTHNNLKTLQPLWDNCLHQCLLAGGEIIIINHNGTDPKCLDFYSNASKSGAKVIDANFKFNFSKLINIGLENSKRENLIIMNDDIEVGNFKELCTLVSYLEDENIGIVGPQLRYPDNTLQHGGIYFPENKLSEHYGRFLSSDQIIADENLQGTRIVPAITGAIMAFRRNLIELIGKWDEELSIESNDLDFCIRTRKIGKKILIDNDIVFVHHESTTRINDSRKTFDIEINSNLEQFFDRHWYYL